MELLGGWRRAIHEGPVPSVGHIKCSMGQGEVCAQWDLVSAWLLKSDLQQAQAHLAGTVETGAQDGQVTWHPEAAAALHRIDGRDPQQYLGKKYWACSTSTPRSATVKASRRSRQDRERGREAG